MRVNPTIKPENNRVWHCRKINTSKCNRQSQTVQNFKSFSSKHLEQKHSIRPVETFRIRKNIPFVQWWLLNLNGDFWMTSECYCCLHKCYFSKTKKSIVQRKLLLLGGCETQTFFTIFFQCLISFVFFRSNLHTKHLWRYNVFVVS